MRCGGLRICLCVFMRVRRVSKCNRDDDEWKGEGKESLCTELYLSASVAEQNHSVRQTVR
jgi:hypothetical protein